METTIDDSAALKHLEREMLRVEPLANAEKQYTAANGDVSNPWRGSVETLDKLRAEHAQLEARIRGKRLSDALAELRFLDGELDAALEERRIADGEERALREHPRVVRYMAAGSTCRKLGYGHSFVLFTQWFETTKAVHDAMPECAGFFLHSADARSADVNFDLEADREAVRAFRAAQGRAEVALARWVGFSDRRAALLRSVPELSSAVL